MKEIEIIDLIISDINKFLIKEKINPVNVDFIQSNGVPSKCEGNISDENRIKINGHLKIYENQYEIIKLIINYRFGNISKMQDDIGKTQLGKRYKNWIKNTEELMEIIKAKNTIKLL